ncbi:hypothetical protein [Solicola gregarius]|uniref:Uncharacterized protein n=1 Tax=Solicola gregarius TaxID=2908642 RepID=A0AA46TG82_9ACTN|nr:hypothetical protein [Solicola gregarius]UYM04279.1 hypothetical protein L0C25_17275 [Solicola gregarius]
MRQVLLAGLALGLAATLVTRCAGDDDFCELASGDGLAAGGVKAGRAYADERADYRDRLDRAAESAPGAIADDVDTIRDAMSRARNPSRVSTRQVDEAFADIDDWTAANC